MDMTHRRPARRAVGEGRRPGAAVGRDLPAEEVAGYAGTLAYELFCGLTQRVHFRHLDAVDAAEPRVFSRAR